eukprot:2795464-Amphidinium_carterae.1
MDSERTYLVKVLTMAESSTGMCNAVIVGSKGADPYDVAEVKSSLLRMASSHPFFSQMENLSSGHCKRRSLRV